MDQNSTSPLLSIVAPAFNEAGGIAHFLECTIQAVEPMSIPYEIIIVDDGSTDSTTDEVAALINKKPNIRLIALSRNYGHEIALAAGIEQAKGEYVVQMDSDMQHPPELIPELFTKIHNHCDVVYAVRNDRKYQGILNRTLAKCFYGIAKKMSGLDISDSATNFIIMNRKVIDAFNQLRENNRHTIMLFAHLGFTSDSITFDYGTRQSGKSKYNYRRLFSLAIDSIISFSNKPLRYMSILSVLISCILVGYTGFVVLQKLFYHQSLAAGVASVICITSGLFAILFLFLAVISEYIGRILTESKNRPLYHIKYEKNAAE